ncbi:hypothetical protein OBBRIDRAFT_788188 [Obba rivulosa]|uniref:37S ribosomal protein mrp10, mitochondrial n=1 Tax=Obba rivulosa TaxID=1052685 RepID=A0A8E2DTN0_9APHY|nr:hypothetical protein OBBRIDRAFT_788188 [Obba rivulosa]
MHIKKLKVRPRKVAGQTLCGPQLTSMLSCWAASSDLLSTGKCQDAAKELYECMRTAPTGAKKQPFSINYHLARLTKNLK